MEDLVESNERTLMIFDSVCLGLAECLALVHSDIKHMSKHRNKLVAQATGGPYNIHAQSSLSASVDGSSCSDELANETLTDNKREPAERAARPSKSIDSRHEQLDQSRHHEDDPHHLARLKLLDKRLADSFSQALSLCDQQKSSLASKHRQTQVQTNRRPNIFQFLLGKKSHPSSKSASGKQTETNAPGAGDRDSRSAMIDDINRQTRLAMQYSKQLEAQLFKIEDLRSRYEMHLKMGLMVKSVSRAYLASPRSSPALPFSTSSQGSCSSSLKRRAHGPERQAHHQHHHTSSLAVNDSASSLGTHTSLSSLNLLSTWSMSRRNKQQQLYRNQNPHYQQSNPKHPGDLHYRELTNHGCVSTISLGSQNNLLPKSRLSGLANKLTSPTGQQPFETEFDDRFYCDADQYSDYAPPANDAPSHGHQMSRDDSRTVLYIGNPNLIDTNRQSLGQYNYGEYATGAVPTTLGTLVGVKVAPTETSLKSSSRVPSLINPVQTTLQKSASQSSLKRIKAYRHGSGSVSSKTTIKEFIENISRLEAEFESHMGTFMLNIEDIQGFARVCQGDVFEVQIRYGDSQKFKARISVLKENKQKCDNRQTVFKAKIAEVIAIKAYECKGLGQKVLLGNKLCETRGLFTARSQMMTISLNQTGSIKLNLVITWNPLHMVPSSSLSQIMPGHDISHISLPPTPVSSSTLSSLSSA